MLLSEYPSELNIYFTLVMNIRENEITPDKGHFHTIIATIISTL